MRTGLDRTPKTSAQDASRAGHPASKRVAQPCAPGRFRWGPSLGTTVVPQAAVRGWLGTPAEQKSFDLAVGGPPSMAASEPVRGGPALAHPRVADGWVAGLGCAPLRCLSMRTYPQQIRVPKPHAAPSRWGFLKSCGAPWARLRGNLYDKRFKCRYKGCPQGQG